jgi:hypothetical protein
MEHKQYYYKYLIDHERSRCDSKIEDIIKKSDIDFYLKSLLLKYQWKIYFDLIIAFTDLKYDNKFNKIELNIREYDNKIEELKLKLVYDMMSDERKRVRLESNIFDLTINHTEIDLLCLIKNFHANSDSLVFSDAEKVFIENLYLEVLLFSKWIPSDFYWCYHQHCDTIIESKNLYANDLLKVINYMSQLKKHRYWI